MKIAIIGTGISGLSAAWLLHPHAKVTLYEQNAYAGGHSHTVDVGQAAGRVPVDTGFIVFNERNYPQLTALFRVLGVESHASDMSFAVSIDSGRLEWAGDNLNTLFGQRRNLLRASHWRMLRDILRFNRDGKQALRSALDPDTTLGSFLDRLGYSDELRYRYLLPMAAAIWSCPMDTMLGFPARSFLRFCNNHGLLNIVNRPRWRTVTGGSREYVRKLTAPLADRLHLNTPVASVRRTPVGVRIRDRQGQQADYDQVIMAAHADQSLALLGDASPMEREILGSFRYQDNRAVLHTDSGLMPKSRRLWASWNYLADDAEDDGARVSVSYWMNRLQALPSTQDLFVTLNPLREPAPESVCYDTRYEHPVFTAATLKARKRLPLIQGKDRVWFCGAWCGYGFHEDGLASAVDVVQSLNLPVPWRVSAPAADAAHLRPPLWAAPSVEKA